MGFHRGFSWIDAKGEGRMMEICGNDQDDGLFDSKEDVMLVFEYDSDCTYGWIQMTDQLMNGS